MVSDPLLSFSLGVACTVGGLKLKQRYATGRAAKRKKKDDAKKVELGLQRAEKADALLKKQGYTIVARDPPASYAMLVTGEPQIVHIHAALPKPARPPSALSQKIAKGKARSEKRNRRLRQAAYALAVAGILYWLFGPSAAPSADGFSPARLQRARVVNE